MKKYVYNLKFARGRNAFVVKSDPVNWLGEDEFRKLLQEGVEQNGRFVESWRTPERKKRA